MKLLMCLCLCLLLSGCSMPVWETVEDLSPELPASTWLEEAYAIRLGLPEDTELLGQTATCSLYQCGSLQIETDTFLASGLESAVKHLSGFGADRLTILETTRFDLPEYQFVWYSQTDEGGRLHRADLVMDGSTCYAVVCSTPEGEDHMDRVRQVFSTFGLSQEEIV